jgi:hypothetical protein
LGVGAVESDFWGCSRVWGLGLFRVWGLGLFRVLGVGFWGYNARNVERKHVVEPVVGPPWRWGCAVSGQTSGFISQKILIKWFQKVNSPTRSSTDRLLLLIQTKFDGFMGELAFQNRLIITLCEIRV